MLTCLFIYFCFVSVYLSSICGDNVTSWNHSHVEKAGSWSWSLNEPLRSHVVIRFNMSRHNSWTSYTYAYETDMLGNCWCKWQQSRWSSMVVHCVWVMHHVAPLDFWLSKVDQWVMSKVTDRICRFCQLCKKTSFYTHVQLHRGGKYVCCLSLESICQESSHSVSKSRGASTQCYKDPFSWNFILRIIKHKTP